MGLQDKYLSTHKTNGASVLVINQTCDNDQLLVSLSKNETKWLSPVGWTDQQKVTLLDCRKNGETTEIDIPAEFAKDIHSGDVLTLRCSELDLEKEIIWEASSVEIRTVPDTATAPTSLAGGLLSRFKSPKPEPVEDTRSETELRAEEANRAAQNFKAKMEAATAAKEDAQRKALEAAREAEAALKMEAERITEMERAAKAFEEAERLKQDEMRRVEEERRAEEARLAEEARRIEEARKREIAAKKEADRKAALTRYEAALDITRNEEVRLKSRLKDLKQQAKSNAANSEVQSEDLDSRRGYLIATEESAAKRAESFEKSALKLDGAAAKLAMIQSNSDKLSADRQDLTARLSQADTAYQQAQKEAEAAIARAEARRAELETMRTDEAELSGRISSVSEKLASQNLTTADITEKTQKLQVKSEAAQAELAQARVEIEALEQAQLVQAEQNQNLRLEIEATQQAIEDSQTREINHREAIEHLEAGGDPDDISDVTVQPRNYNLDAGKDSVPETTIAAAKDTESGLLNRVRRSFAREKDVEINIEVEDVVLDAADVKADPVLVAGLDDTPSFVRRHGSSLMALGAVIGGIAILGGGYALNQASSPKLEVKSSTPAPTQVASAVTKVELPKISELKEVEAVQEGTNAKVENIVVDAAPLKTKLAKIETKPSIKKATIPLEVKENTPAVKYAEVVDPTGFAFDLPDMTPTKPYKTKAVKTPTSKKASVKKTSVKKAVPKKAEVQNPVVVKEAAVTKTEAKLVSPETKAPVVEEVVNYPELTMDIQTRLQNLGFYTGGINGVQTRATKEAITNFKTLFSLPIDDKITGALLTELKRAERDQEAAQILQAAQAQATAEAEAQAAAVQVAEAAPLVEFYDTVQAVPSTPVVTDSLPAASSVMPANDALPAYVEPEPEPVKVASIPTVVEPEPTPAVQDVIVEAKLTRSASAEYPGAAQRRNYYVNVAIEVAYDIDATGRVTNLSIASNDHDGKYNEAFEKEAMKAIEKLRYEPKTVNGVAVESEGRQKRIVFRVE